MSKKVERICVKEIESEVAVVILRIESLSLSVRSNKAQIKLSTSCLQKH